MLTSCESPPEPPPVRAKKGGIWRHRRSAGGIGSHQEESSGIRRHQEESGAIGQQKTAVRNQSGVIKCVKDKDSSINIEIYDIKHMRVKFLFIEEVVFQSGKQEGRTMKKKIRNLVIITAIAGLLYTHGMDLIMTCFALGYYAYKGFPQEVYLDVAFQDNVFFDTYDVDVYIDDEKIDTIPHGKYYTDMLFDLRKGTHMISFRKVGDLSVSGNYAFDVKGETTFKCMIHARHSDILVDQVQVFDSLVGNAIKMVDTEGMYLADARRSLWSQGFVNVTSAADDDYILDENNWIVVSQNVEAEKVYDKNTAIVLQCEHIRR